MKLKKLSLIYFILFGTLIIYAYSAIIQRGITVYSAIDKSKIGIDEQIILRLTIAGAGFFPNPKLPQIKDFNIIKTGQFTGADFSKGRPIPYTVFEYVLTPYHKGNFIIPKISVYYKGFNYSSEEYEITVSDKIRQVKSDEVQYQETKIFQKNINLAPIFIRSAITSNNVFYNQQIVYTYTVFTRVPIKAIPKVQIPEFEGFRYEKLYYRKEYNTKFEDVLYRAFEFKFALFPFMTDTQKIPAIKMICDRSIFLNPLQVNSFFKGQNYFIKNTEAFNVEVTPIPIQGKPLNFGGLIGEFDIIAEVEEKEVGLDGILYLDIKIKGVGNINSVPTIKAPFTKKLREFNSDSFVNYDKKKDKVVGEKIFRFAFIPIEIGEDIIPSIGFSYFDDVQGKYLTKYTEPITVKILKKKKEVENFEEEQEPAKEKSVNKNIFI
ncbi:MAG: BatD family protein, partial [Elusimicrobiota bacterium]|nr:BatD family protein [Elusimicrobiota bacterium]